MSINIKKENIGKFNATKARTGKTTEELTHSSNPLTRKRAIFAQNFGRSNQKRNGGFVENSEHDLSLNEIKRLESLGYKLKY